MATVASNQGFSSGINAAMVENEYFSAHSEKIIDSKLLRSSPYTVLKPKNGMVDVHADMYWSNMGNKSEVPNVFVIERELKYGAWAAELANILKLGGQIGTNTDVDTFMQLYAAEETGFYYNFPWLLKSGDNIRSIENSWSSITGLTKALTTSSKSNSKDAGLLDTIIPAAIGVATGAITPGFGFEETKQYDGTSQQTLTVSFPLYNTIDIRSALRHFNFVNLFTFQNLKTRTSLMSYIPPKIYTVDAYSLGGIYMSAAYVSNFKVDSIGTTRKMTEWGIWGNAGVLIPEAYKVTITFTDLLSQSSNVFAGTLGGNKVQVTNNNIEQYINTIEDKVAPVTDTLAGWFNNAYNFYVPQPNSPNPQPPGP
jgi:hypothetical protein